MASANNLRSIINFTLKCAVTSVSMVFCNIPHAKAQIKTDSLYQLKTLEVEGSRLHNFSTGAKVQKIDSAIMRNFNSNSLADLLAQHSQIFIKSYGQGNLATPSIRGTGASHTAVMWNGFNISTPTLGQTDFSVLPVNFIDEVQIQYGGAGALFGSGAIGGTIHLNNVAKFEKGVSAGFSGSAGSFGNYQQGLNFKLSKERFISSFKIFNHTVTNDFPYRNTAFAGKPTVRQQNAAVIQRGFLQENYFKINELQQINLHVWIQENGRQVALPMTSSTGASSLKNNFLRATSEWKKTGEKVISIIRAAYFNEALKYNDPIGDNYSNTFFQTFIAEAESKIVLSKKQMFNLGINNTFSTASSENKIATNGYLTKPQQNRSSFFASYKVHTEKNIWSGIISFRQELVGGKAIPITPTIGFEGRLIKGWFLSGNISRNYRVPTFNDLYWQPGGNINLQPESGWSQEAGITKRGKSKSFSHDINFTLFNSNINNWIIWLPGTSFWTPQNIQSVWSRGLETTIKLNRKINAIDFHFSVMYNYVISTNEKSKSANDVSLGKQLIYVPLYNGQANFSIIYKSFYMSYVHTYTGNRFTTSDNTEYVKGYMLGNLSCNKKIRFKNINGSINMQVNNVWNKAYQVLLWQAMPLRNYQIGLSISFNKTSTN